MKQLKKKTKHVVLYNFNQIKAKGIDGAKLLCRFAQTFQSRCNCVTRSRSLLFVYLFVFLASRRRILRKTKRKSRLDSSSTIDLYRQIGSHVIIVQGLTKRMAVTIFLVVKH